MSRTPSTGQVELAGRTARSRVLFGPHETNLARGRAISIGARRLLRRARRRRDRCARRRDGERHRRRPALRTSAISRGQCVRDGPRWRRPAGPSGRSCSRGSSTPGGRAPRLDPPPAGGPVRVPDVASRQLPAALTAEGIDAVVRGFAEAAAMAKAARARRRRGGRRCPVAAAPVRFAPDQPAGRRVRHRPLAAARPRAARGARGARTRRCAGPAAVR